jgi:hypothetical protein
MVRSRSAVSSLPCSESTLWPSDVMRCAIRSAVSRFCAQALRQ